jgi:ABC-type dipeptide/oligopeptide/nickel transport systems, permease components
MDNKWRNFYSNWVSVFGLIILLLLTVTALIGPLIAPFDPEDLEISRRATAPNAMYWVGTDELGKDVFSRAVTATRVSLLVVIIAPGVSPLGVILVGILPGFF